MFDPDQPHKTFIMKEDRVLELTEHDLEQGGQMEEESEVKMIPGVAGDLEEKEEEVAEEKK